jgi:hypothetical protein
MLVPRALMDAALEAAWAEFTAVTEGKTIDCSGLRTILSLSIMVAVRDGERDLSRLKRLALDNINGLY